MTFPIKLRHALPLAGGLALVLAAPGFADDAPAIPGQVDVSRVTAGTYATDPGHTLVSWRLNHFGFKPSSVSMPHVNLYESGTVAPSAAP